jgi:hypothetical protein
MSRTIHYNMVIDKTRTDGGFASTTWWLQDPDNGTWSQMPALPGQEADSVKLQPDDIVSVAIGESLGQNSTSTAVSTLDLAVVFGSRNVPNQSNSPFQGQSSPTCLFVGSTGNGLQQAWGPGNNNGGYFAWVLPLGTVGTVPTGPSRKFELMVGANVTFNDGTPARSFGHDPEVDVGMGSN